MLCEHWSAVAKTLLWYQHKTQHCEGCWGEVELPLSQTQCKVSALTYSAHVSTEQVLHVQVEQEPHHVWYLGPVWERWMPFCAVSECHEDSTQRSWCISFWERQWFHQLLFWFPPPGSCWSVIWHAAYPGEEIPIPVAVLQWRNLQFQTSKCYVHDKAITKRIFFFLNFKTGGYLEHLQNVLD